MDETKKKDFEQLLEKYNEEHKPWPVLHINTTFEKLANAFGEVIEDRDYEMQDVLEDYLEYCYHDGLITVSDSWKYMRMQLAGTTLEFNAGHSGNSRETKKRNLDIRSAQIPSDLLSRMDLQKPEKENYEATN